MAKKKQKAGANNATIRDWINGQPKERRSGLRAALSELRKLHREDRSTQLTWWHEVGVQVNAFFPKGTRNYGGNVAKLLAKALVDGEDAVTRVSNLLWKARKVAQNLSKQEVRVWSKKWNSRGEPLSAYHVHKVV